MNVSTTQCDQTHWRFYAASAAFLTLLQSVAVIRMVSAGTPAAMVVEAEVFDRIAEDELKVQLRPTTPQVRI